MTHKLDKLDIAILEVLQTNGRIKNVDLAERVALSPSPCLQRVKRMEKLGYIKSYGAEIAIKKITDTIIIFTQFTITEDSLDDQRKFEAHICQYPEAVECYLSSGGFDYQVKFVCRSIDHYQSVIKSILDSDMRIKKYHSYVVMKEVLNRKGLPLSNLLKRD